MPHLSELHGAATHLAVVAVPVYLLILLVRRAGRGGPALTAAEPWVVGAALAGVALAGLTGLLVWGQSKTDAARARADASAPCTSGSGSRSR